MYSFRNITTKNPLQISGGFVAVANAVCQALHVSAGWVSVVNLALLTLLGLFVSTTTANKAVLDDFASATPESTSPVVVAAVRRSRSKPVGRDSGRQAPK